MPRYNKTRKGGANYRIGIMNPTYGGKTPRKGGGCGCGGPTTMAQLPPGLSLGPLTASLKGGACPCQAVPPIPTPLGGGYRATKRNLKYLKKWKRGESIGFTIRSSLKAKGLIPRANGTKRVSPKYRK